MSLSDPIADALTKIRNAYRAGHKHVNVNHNNITEAIVSVLSEENFINSYEIIARPSGDVGKMISINLRYTNSGKATIRDIKRVSKPGRRVYVKAHKMPRVLNNIGCAIISTNKGVMVDRKAREECVGGEYICKVW